MVVGGGMGWDGRKRWERQNEAGPTMSCFYMFPWGSWHATPPAYDTMGRSVCGPWVVCGPRSSSVEEGRGRMSSSGGTGTVTQ